MTRAGSGGRRTRRQREACAAQEETERDGGAAAEREASHLDVRKPRTQPVPPPRPRGALAAAAASAAGMVGGRGGVRALRGGGRVQVPHVANEAQHMLVRALATCGCERRRRRAVRGLPVGGSVGVRAEESNRRGAAESGAEESSRERRGREQQTERRRQSSRQSSRESSRERELQSVDGSGGTAASRARAGGHQKGRVVHLDL